MPTRLRTALEALAALAATAFALLFFVLAALRARYPYELEWMEGACVDHVARILSTGRLYEPPSIEFVPYLYAPLYFYVSAGLSAVLGPGFLAPRLVSIAAVAGVFALMERWVRRETHARYAGLVAAGVFAATFRASGAWFDLVRVDSLFLLLVLGGAYALRFGAGMRSAVAAGALLGLAVLTKQTGVLLAAALALGALPRWRRSAAFAAVAAAVAGLGGLAFELGHDGWFSYYVFSLPAGHSLAEEGRLDFWTHDLGGHVPVAAALALALLAGLAGRRSFAPLAFYGALFAGALGASWSSRLHPGGYDNVLIPAFAVLALGAGLAAGHVARAARAEGGGSGLARTAALLVPVAVLAQLALLRYDPSAQVPRAADREAGDRLVERLRSIEGEVFIPSHGYLAAAAGKSPHVHLMALLDVVRAEDKAPGEALKEEIRAALRARRFGALLLDSPYFVRNYGAGQYYRKVEDVLGDEDGFWPVTGRATRPVHLYLPR
ncbi:MAG: glycosyltransferase family 39 protein [Planctomycetota bacterium]